MVYFVNISCLNTNPGNVHLEQSEETYTAFWKQFLSTDTAESLVPDWETKLQAVNSYMYITPSGNDSLEEDNNADNERSGCSWQN